MKLSIIALLLLQASPPPAPDPQLSTAEKAALQMFESQKQQAQQAEFLIDREFRAAHPGFYINLQTFSVEKIPIQQEPPAAKK